MTMEMNFADPSVPIIAPHPLSILDGRSIEGMRSASISVISVVFPIEWI